MNKTSTILLVDGNALLYRAYHAFPKELTTPGGEPVGAVYGFTRILLTTIKTVKPTAVAMCFDLKGPTFRHAQYADYKATRQKMPDDLVAQIEKTHEIVRYLEFPIYTAEGYEADDVIAAIAKQATSHSPNCKVIILTGDQDILQLVNDQVAVYMPASPPKQPTLYTSEKVVEKYGFQPAQMVEFKALRGDPSDNIPGVPGIGEVTATKLVQEFGNIDVLYKHINQGQTASLKPAVLQKLIEYKDKAYLSHELATIQADAPVEYSEQDCSLELQHPEALIAYFQQLGFRSLIQFLPLSHRLLSEAADVFTSSATSPTSESEKIDQELAPLLREMEKRGVKVDCNYLKHLEEEFDQELDLHRKKLVELAGVEFNPDSPQQTAHVLYEVLHIPTTLVRKGKTGYTTDAGTLLQLADQFPIAQLLLSYRELNKLQNTYVRPLQELTDERGRIHTSYAPDTSTGRISSRNPNLQNIPIRTQQGRRLRQAFIADKGNLLISADYSQIELRVAAHLADEPAMKKVFQEGGDFHAATADRMGVDRRVAKIINFSILYGKGAFGFAQDLNISVAQARAYIDQYFATYQKLRLYLDNILEEGRKKGYVESLYGRRRALPDLTSSNFQRRSAAEREALNFPIQAAAAEILKIAMNNLEKSLRKAHSAAQLILTVHDELVLEVPQSEVETASALLCEAMQHAAKLSVPLEVHLKQGSNWAEMEELAS